MSGQESTNKFLFFLPNIFTGLNIGCGFAAIMLSYTNHHYQACLFLILGAIFDSVDGRLARLTGTESSFGEQFDSMSDVISFGVAPALVMYKRFFVDYGRLGMVVSFVFLLCGAMRLARFNANIDKISSDYFQGLPIPLGAMGPIGMILFSLKFPEVVNYPYLLMLYLVFFSFLMISNIPFPSFKKSLWIKEHKKQVLLLIFFILTFMILFEEYSIISLISVYIIGSLTYFAYHYKNMKRMFKFNP